MKKLLIIFTLGVLYLFFPLGNDEMVVRVPNGFSFAIARGMDHLVKSPVLFTIWSKVLGLKMKTGEFLIKKNTNPYQILKTFHAGKSISRLVLIPEGITAYEVCQILFAKNIKGKCQAKDGDIFPDKYDYDYNTTIEQLLSNMRKKNQRVLDKVIKKYGFNDVIKTRDQLLSLAAIIESEAIFDDEKKVIASLYINRLKINMPLQADPTVIYAITEGKKSRGIVLTHKDLKYNSNYNTYVVSGLPKIICAPGEKSLEAALNPSDTVYLYMVADSSGRHIFAKNYKDHLQNIKSARQIKKS